MTMKNILNRKVVVASLVIASTLLCVCIVYIVVERPAEPSSGLPPVSVALTIIPASTSTPRSLPPTLTPLPTSPLSSPTPAPGQIAVGVYVQVSAAALHVRAKPGLSNEPLFLAFDSEVFLVTDGPEHADGYTWWYLTASYDTSRAGWAAQDFLTAIPSP
jgi:hypothetical protein